MKNVNFILAPGVLAQCNHVGRIESQSSIALASKPISRAQASATPDRVL